MMNYKNNLELSIYLRSFGIFDTNIISVIEETPLELFITRNTYSDSLVKKKDEEFKDAYLSAFIAE